MALNLDIRVGRPWAGLGGAYARGEPEALRWFGADWRDPDAWRERARLVQGRFDAAARRRAVGMLHAPHDATRARLARIADGEGFLVTTGQQPALLSGPAYTVYKALSAIALARWLEELLAAPVVPVFWVASEDHDWAEGDHTDLLGVDNELHRIQVAPPPGAGERPLHRLPLGADVEAALARTAELLPQTEFTPLYLDQLRAVWKPGVTLNAGVHGTLATLLGEHGLAFVDAADPALKAASAPLLETAARDAEHLERALAARAGELKAAGWEPQVQVMEDGVNLFVEGPAGRERLYRHDGGYRLRKSGTRLTLDELRARLATEPDAISPNVLLRPVVEAAVLPTLGYVAGPGETAYHAQLAPLFEGHGVPQPIVFPRFSALLLEAKIAKVLAKLGIEADALARPSHELAAAHAREQLPEPVQRALADLHRALDGGTGALTDAARAIDPTLQGPVQRVKTVAADALAEAERKILQAVKRQSETHLQQLEKARLHLFPGGTPQERVVSPFYYLARYGPELIGALLERFAQGLPAVSPAGSMAPPGEPG
jgi:bacillithiol biosynthesis cysteine-adding enzyme BshC